MNKSIQEQLFVAAGDIDWEKTDEGIKRKILAHDNVIMMVSVCFEKGAIGILHSHINRQVSYVESGRFEVTINGNKKILEKGDSFLVAPGLSHGVVALEKGILIDVFTPVRKDFL